MATAHWAETPRELFEEGPLAAHWTELGDAAGSMTVGVNRIEILVPKERRQSPPRRTRDRPQIALSMSPEGLW